MTSSIDGLVSGMDTASMISQLMQVEAVPQNQLKSKISVQNKAVTAYQAVNTKLAALATAAKALGTDDTWGTAKTTSSSDAAIVTAKAGTPTGSLTFSIKEVAATHSQTFTGSFVDSATDAVNFPVVANESFKILLATDPPTETTITAANKSLQAVVNAINGTENAAYKAAAVQIEPNKYTLQLTATTSGTKSTFAVEANGGVYNNNFTTLGVPTLTTRAKDAELQIGGNPDDPDDTSVQAYTVKSTSNTFTDVLPGLTVTVTKKQADPVTIGIANDSAAVADKVAAMVEAAEAALGEIRSATATKTANNPTAGALPGDAALRSLGQSILSAVGGGAGADLGSLADVGVNMDKTGSLSFDREKFLAAFEANPAKTRAYFDKYTPVEHPKANPHAFDPGWDTATGIARKLQTISVQATEGILLPTDGPGAIKQGTLAGIIQRRNETIKGLNDQVAAWDVRLEMRKENLQRQFSNLEVALSKMQQQSSWLAGQLAGLG